MFMQSKMDGRESLIRDSPVSGFQCPTCVRPLIAPIFRNGCPVQSRHQQPHRGAHPGQLAAPIAVHAPQALTALDPAAAGTALRLEGINAIASADSVRPFGGTHKNQK